MRVMIVEDNRSEREYFARIVTEISGVEPVCCENAEAAEEALEKGTFDLFLLDVELPGKSGFDLAEYIRTMQGYALTPILFITGNEKDCLSAFQTYHCYDYIIKPVSREELREKTTGVMTAVRNQAKEKEREKVICISSAEGDVFLKKSALLFVEIRGGNCMFHMKADTFEKRGISLSSLIDEFDNEVMVRCHRSFAVNMDNITEIKNINYRLWEAHFQDSDKTVDISKKYYDDVISRMKKKM